MLKQTVTYENFNGFEVTEDLYFNLSTPELARLSARYGGDVSEYATKLAKSGNLDAMLHFIEDLMLTSYGKKSDDGKRFVKTKEVREEFEYSIAYATLFEELLTDPDKAQAFGHGLAQGAATSGKQKQSQAAQLIAQRQAEKQSFQEG